MDNSPEGVLPQEISALSYDDTVAYEEQLPTEEERASLVKRIGTSKVYLLSESSAATRVGKRKHDDDDEENDEEMDEDLSYRPNAILFNGSPIANLPTTRIFAYATHFDAHPMGLEWVDDNTCVLVFESRKAAREAFTRLQKSASEAPDMDELFTAKSFPIALWPPEERINSTLGQGQGLKGALRLRWARPGDVKKKGAKKESQFYRKHGSSAGKELFNGRDLPPPKRRRRDDVDDEDQRRAQLDQELDDFLADDDDEKTTDVEAEPDVPASPPSKMRSDYIASDGRTLLERTSVLRQHDEPPALSSRLTAPLPRRARQRRGHGSAKEDGLFDSLTDRLQPAVTNPLEWGREPDQRSGRWGQDSGDEPDGHSGRKSRRNRDRPTKTSTARPRKTQQELDDELDAFLRSSN